MGNACSNHYSFASGSPNTEVRMAEDFLPDSHPAQQP
jgi:hypothetical protein